jgi:hypothetical protein
MFFRKKKKIREYNGLFNGHFIDVKAFYALEFDCLASISFISELDTSSAYGYLVEHLQKEIIAIYQHTYFDHTENELFFNNTIFVLSGKRMIELSTNYCTVLHTCQQHQWGSALIKSLASFRLAQNGNTIGFTWQTAMN